MSVFDDLADVEWELHVLYDAGDKVKFKAKYVELVKKKVGLQKKAFEKVIV